METLDQSKLCIKYFFIEKFGKTINIYLYNIKFCFTLKNQYTVDKLWDKLRSTFLPMKFLVAQLIKKIIKALSSKPELFVA